MAITGQTSGNRNQPRPSVNTPSTATKKLATSMRKRMTAESIRNANMRRERTPS
jgi:hypothetical protein